MDFSSNLDFLAPNDIRVRGSRIGIETVLHEYLHGQTPESIVRKYPTLTLSQVHATIWYYLENKNIADAYLAAWDREGKVARERQDRSPSAAIARLRAVKHRGSPNELNGNE